jgi:type I restriction enzyme S subunit
MAMPKAYPIVALGDVCKFVGGGTPSRKQPEYFDGDIPWVTVKDFKRFRIADTEEHISEAAVADSATNIVEAGTVLLVSRVGLGKVAIAERRLAINQDIKGLTPTPNILSDYLFWFLLSRTDNIKRMGAGATVKGITLPDIKAIRMPAPPLDEQRRIVDLLSRAEGIVRLRREAQKKAAELIPALFLDMFGDPATNPKGWPVRRVSDFVARFVGGKNLQAGSVNPSGFRILKVSAATSGIYRESESKPTPDDYMPPKNHIVCKGDLLFSRANTEELVGATALVEETNGKTLLPDKLWRFVWSEPVEPLYIHALFQNAHIRQKLGKLSSGTSASMRNISQAKLFAMTLPVAPIENQRLFAESVRSIRSIQSQQAAATHTAEAIFDALLAQVFQN